ncbi:MAG: hypothetical protein ACT4UQ_00680 [Gammaproteobacteria bacterium]
MNRTILMRSLRKLAVCAALAIVAGAASAESDIELQGGVGYDSNVYDLNPVVGVLDGFFTELEATVEARGVAAGGWSKRADIGISGRLYESALGDADEGRFYVRARGSSEEKYDQNGWDWSLRYQARDRTYVSQLTGQEGTDDAGNQIGDRYDNSAGDLRASWRLPGWKIGRLSLEGSIRDRNYFDDYEQFGLERLDYHEYGIAPGYELGGRDRRVRVTLRLEERIYRDRRTSDAGGNSVAGTDLEYRYYGVEASYRHRFSRRIALEFSGGYEIREDNGVGYADRRRWDAELDWTLRFAGDNRLSVESGYSSRVLDQQVVGDPTINDEEPQRKGFKGAVRYSRPFPFLDRHGFSLVAEANWMSYDNSRDPRYAYDRVTGFLGVQQDF